MSTKFPHLTKMIPDGSVMLLYWVRMPGDARHVASGTGHVIRASKGCFQAARELDFFGDRQLHALDGQGVAAAGHGVTILWPNGHTRTVRV